MNSKQRATKKDDKSVNSASKIAVGAAVVAVMFFVMIAVYALVALKTGSGSSMYMPVGALIGALSGLIGGFVAAKLIAQKGIVFGALSAFISAILCSAVMFFVNGNKSGTGIFIFMAAMILGGALGGVAAMNMKIKKKY